MNKDREAPLRIIVRKKRHDHGGHGGAWKVAFADFMTAMMALFLVMWLVNAASKDTRAQVASYFNPIKLKRPNQSPKRRLTNRLRRMAACRLVAAPHPARKINSLTSIRKGCVSTAAGTTMKR